MNNRYVQIAICGMGASSGLALVMAIKSAVNTAIGIEIAPGTILRSNNSSDQDMVIGGVEAQRETNDEIFHACAEAADRQEKFARQTGQFSTTGWTEVDSIQLPPLSTRLYLVSAYCIDFHKDNPSASTRFGVGPADPGLARLFSAMEQSSAEFDDVSVQIAIWAMRENLSRAEILSKFRFTANQLTQACQLLGLAGINPAGRQLCAR